MLVAVARSGAAQTPSAATQKIPGFDLLADGTLDLRWTTPPDTVAAPPAFDAATAYVPTRSRSVLALDLDTGVARWHRDVATTFSPAVGGELVFVVAQDGVEALRASTGATAWKRAMPDPIATPAG
jgi:outer membrane protein assembly factor BamB